MSVSPVRQCRRHQQIFGAGDGRFAQVKNGAPQPLTTGFNITVLNANVDAHFFESLQVDIYRPQTDGAAAGQGDARVAVTRQQGPQRQYGSAHFPHHIVRRRLSGQPRRANMDPMPGVRVIHSPFGEQHQCRINVAQTGDI